MTLDDFKLINAHSVAVLKIMDSVPFAVSIHCNVSAQDEQNFKKTLAFFLTVYPASPLAKIASLFED